MEQVATFDFFQKATVRTFYSSIKSALKAYQIETWRVFNKIFYGFLRKHKYFLKFSRILKEKKTERNLRNELKQSKTT